MSILTTKCTFALRTGVTETPEAEHPDGKTTNVSGFLTQRLSAGNRETTKKESEEIDRLVPLADGDEYHGEVHLRSVTLLAVLVEVVETPLYRWTKCFNHCIYISTPLAPVHASEEQGRIVCAVMLGTKFFNARVAK
jgi:hypothetical protein